MKNNARIIAIVSTFVSSLTFGVTVTSAKISGQSVEVRASYEGCREVALQFAAPQCTKPFLYQCSTNISLAADPGECGRQITQTATFDLRNLGLTEPEYSYGSLYVQGSEGGRQQVQIPDFLKTIPVKILHAFMEGETLKLKVSYQGCRLIPVTMNFDRCSRDSEQRWCEGRVEALADSGTCSENHISYSAWTMGELRLDQPAYKGIKAIILGADDTEATVTLPE